MALHIDPHRDIPPQPSNAEDTGDLRFTVSKRALLRTTAEWTSILGVCKTWQAIAHKTFGLWRSSALRGNAEWPMTSVAGGAGHNTGSSPARVLDIYVFLDARKTPPFTFHETLTIHASHINSLTFIYASPLVRWYHPRVVDPWDRFQLQLLSGAVDDFGVPTVCIYDTTITFDESPCPFSFLDTASSIQSLSMNNTSPPWTRSNNLPAFCSQLQFLEFGSFRRGTKTLGFYHLLPYLESIWLRSVDRVHPTLLPHLKLPSLNRVHMVENARAAASATSSLPLADVDHLLIQRSNDAHSIELFKLPEGLPRISLRMAREGLDATRRAFHRNLSPALRSIARVAPGLPLTALLLDLPHALRVRPDAWGALLRALPLLRTLVLGRDASAAVAPLAEDDALCA
ncbi:uncharacterized protein BXZ73DRAFT_82058 [Epithele typhae]|uniref:uncharacterized protein n=1 Tax=Epithele typhae TaxID=378194 RepID=UPI002008D773|nr:uncharacterized protein BXZ73DRAFT_82058 [Epithele typhae]KAH9912965.1 hypothetical protein BXZ73DRAFT_82058 [Epithele typhae]